MKHRRRDALVKLCPFCGGEPVTGTTLVVGERGEWAHCQTRHCPISGVYITKKEWNRQSVVDACHKVIDEADATAQRLHIMLENSRREAKIWEKQTEKFLKKWRALQSRGKNRKKE